MRRALSLIRRAAILSPLLLNIACTSSGDNLFKTAYENISPLIGTSKAELDAQRALVNAAVTADPEALRNFPAPILLVTAEAVDVVAIVGPMTSHGDESVWFSADDKSVAFRAGQVVGTRGMPTDLQSAAPPDVRTRRGPAVRDHYYRGGDEVIRRSRFFCEITDKGAATARVLDRIYPTRLVEESCEGEGQRFTNAYWIGTGGEFRLTRQWIAPDIGYVTVHKIQN